MRAICVNQMAPRVAPPWLLCVGVRPMKKFLLATVAIAAFGAAAADAADLGYRAPYQKAPYAAPLYNWTGFYVGAHVGGAFSSDSNFNGLAIGNNSNGRVLGGLQGGYDWQFNPNWVVGVE